MTHVILLVCDILKRSSGSNHYLIRLVAITGSIRYSTFFLFLRLKTDANNVALIITHESFGSARLPFKRQKISNHFIISLSIIISNGIPDEASRAGKQSIRFVHGHQRKQFPFERTNFPLIVEERGG